MTILFCSCFEGQFDGSSLIQDRGGQFQDVALLLRTNNWPVIPPFWWREALPHVRGKLRQAFLTYLKTSVIKNHVYPITMQTVCTFSPLRHVYFWRSWAKHGLIALSNFENCFEVEESGNCSWDDQPWCFSSECIAMMRSWANFRV